MSKYHEFVVQNLCSFKDNDHVSKVMKKAARCKMGSF